MYVLGTAGHVDHGKSTLIHALTGIDPDRLAEEKARGLTIDLGFAWFTTPAGREVGVVDVPGHERFVHNMLAGVGSIDATIFVVAANEGWRPQSEEHMQILDLLGARGGVVALTKSDAVDSDTLELAREEIADRVKGTALDGAEIVPVSARTRDGLDALLGALDRLLDRTTPSPDLARPRLFVDRSFSIKGAGTVVTGTLTGGTLAIDDDIEIPPGGGRARVRGIQTHHRDRPHAEPGSRVALNLAGLERSEIARGDAVVRPGQWEPSRVLGVHIRAVRSLAHPLTPRGSFKLYVGAAEAEARLTLLDAEQLRAGEEALARITLDVPVVVTETDRFVLRDTGRRETVAGGVVLDAHTAMRETRASATARLSARHHAGSLPEVILRERGVIANEHLVAITGRAAIESAVVLHTFTVDPIWLQAKVAAATHALRAFHAAEPLARGMPRDDLRRALGIEDARLFNEIIASASDAVSSDGTVVRLASFSVRLSPEQDRARSALLEAASGYAPPSLAELRSSHGAKLVDSLLDAGDLVKISPEMVFTRAAIEEAVRRLSDAFARQGPLTTSSIRELLGTSRKYAIPLLEHFDRSGFTRRDGDVRVVRTPAP